MAGLSLTILVCHQDILNSENAQKRIVRYPDPHLFLPERFLDPKNTQMDPRELTFGFGRRSFILWCLWYLILLTYPTRKCPGSELVDSVVWITIATILAVSAIRPSLDDKGEESVPALAYSTGAIRSVALLLTFRKNLNSYC
jgi:hypothetical protein